MANRRFTEADIVRAIRGFEAAGVSVGSITIAPDRTIGVSAKGYENTISAAEQSHDWREGSPLYAAAAEREREAEKRAFSVRSLAERWQCSDGLVRNMIARGELRSFRHGNLIRITAEAVGEVEARREPRGPYRKRAT